MSLGLKGFINIQRKCHIRKCSLLCKIHYFYVPVHEMKCNALINSYSYHILEDFFYSFGVATSSEKLANKFSNCLFWFVTFFGVAQCICFSIAL